VTDTLLPVAIRVVRPYATEDELLENELETFTRTSITLLGAQPRPQGLMLRFELALSSGHALVRGEGRVVGYKPDAYYGTGGLTLRFTRLDSRSKAFVDKAAALRERRRPSFATALVETPSLPSPPFRVEDPDGRSLAPAAAWSTPEPGKSVVSAAAESREDPRSPSQHPRDPPWLPPAGRQTLRGPPPAPEIRPAHASSPGAEASGGEGSPSPMQSRDRDALLERLRARSKALDGDAVRKILERRR
jgi:hypothetical protein